MAYSKDRRRHRSAENRIAQAYYHPGSFPLHFGTQQKYAFIAPTDCEVVDANLVTDTASTSAVANTGSNNVSFLLVNLTGTTALMGTAANTGVTAITADTPYNLPIGTADNIIEEGQVLELQVIQDGSGGVGWFSQNAETMLNVEYRPCPKR